MPAKIFARESVSTFVKCHYHQHDNPRLQQKLQLEKSVEFVHDRVPLGDGDSDSEQYKQSGGNDKCRGKQKFYFWKHPIIKTVGVEKFEAEVENITAYFESFLFLNRQFFCFC